MKAWSIGQKNTFALKTGRRYCAGSCDWGRIPQRRLQRLWKKNSNGSRSCQSSGDISRELVVGRNRSPRLYRVRRGGDIAFADFALDIIFGGLFGAQDMEITRIAGQGRMMPEDAAELEAAKAELERVDKVENVGLSVLECVMRGIK